MKNNFKKIWVKADDFIDCGNGLFSASVSHNLNTRYLDFEILNTRELKTLFKAYCVVDKNNIIIYNDTQEDVIVNIRECDAISIMVNANDFKEDKDLFSVLITHNLGTKFINIDILNAKGHSLLEQYNIIDSNNIVVFNNIKEDLEVIVKKK